jgi:putative lipoic acid-binding regulatory protein
VTAIPPLFRLKEEDTIEETPNDSRQKPILEYPCRWIYKVIGADKGEMEKAIGEIVQGCDCTVTPSNTSKTGRYHCLNLEILVHGEGQRTGIYDRLQGHPAIRIVL